MAAETEPEDDGPEVDNQMDKEFATHKEQLKAMEFSELLEIARREMIEDLMVRVRLGLASHQDLAVLRNLLKDNGMTMVPIKDRDYESEREGSEGLGLPEDFTTRFDDEGVGTA